MKRLLISASLFNLISLGAYAVCGPADLCAQVSGLEDFNLGTYTYSGGINQQNLFCVGTQNDDEADFQMTVTGDGAGSAFIITNGTTEVPVDVFIEDVSPEKQAVAGLDTAYTDADTVSVDCNGGTIESTRVRIFIDPDDLEFATSGSYSGTLSFDVQAD